METPIISGYQFRPEHLQVAARTPGIGAFMRCRNGADFVESTIRSHFAHYDEIVVVHNQCTDATPEILARLGQELGPKLRVCHYTDRVQPLGSEGHARTPGDHPESMVNYSNFALAQTRFQIAVKLDDDHLAIPDEVARMVRALRDGRADLRYQHCFSGFNLARSNDGTLGIPAFDPLVGGGDHGYFRVLPTTLFQHDRRFERFSRGPLARRFAGFFYWHLKYLKAGRGFWNYELGDNPESRYSRKKAQFENSPLLDMPEIRTRLKPGPGDMVAALLSEKARLKLARDRSIAAMFPDASLNAALDRLSPLWRDHCGLDQDGATD